MITIKQWMEIIDYKITEGSDFFADSESAKGTLYMLSSWNGDHDGWSFSITFDPQDDQKVYFAEACDYKNNRAYRLTNPDCSIDLDKTAWDDCKYTELEVDSEFIEKSQAIKRGENYDTRVQIPLDLDEKTMFELMKRAHESDITLNQQIERIVREMIERNEPVVKNPQLNQ
jgi:hypothetical protein